MTGANQYYGHSQRPRVTHWLLMLWLAAADYSAADRQPQPSQIIDGVPLFTNDSVPHPPPGSTDSAALLERLRTTCQFWQLRYRREKTELSRLNMNRACADAAAFARRELGKREHYTPAPPPARPKARGGAVLLHESSGDATLCKHLAQEKKRIEQRLRQGYKGDQGDALRRQRRAVNRRLREEC